MKSLYFSSLLLITLALTGCSKYTSVSLNYPVEPVAYLPQNIKTVALINRSLTEKSEKADRMIEAIITGEIAGSDKAASDLCIEGVYERLKGYNEIYCVIPDEFRMYGTGTRKVPELLDWDIVQSVCDSNKADALLVLESFDSNTDYLFTAANKITKILTKTPPHPADDELTVNVVTYWRLYDPSVKQVVDQYESTRHLKLYGNEFTIPRKALQHTAYSSGQEYIERFMPAYYNASRVLFKKGKGSANKDFKRAARYARIDDWKSASDIWYNITQNSNTLNAGRASLNMAVAYEVSGDIDLAIQWAQTAYTDYDLRLGKEYANILINRDKNGIEL